jgi:hypothetical protein
MFRKAQLRYKKKNVFQKNYDNLEEAILNVTKQREMLLAMR